MLAVYLIERFDRFGSALVLLVFASLGVLAGLMYAVGLLGLLLDLVQRLFLACIRLGFGLWRRFLSWASWPLFLLLVFGLLLVGTTQGQQPGWEWLGLLCGVALLFA